jgi:L-asparaginase
VAVGSLGGTITMTAPAAGGGVRPELTAADLLRGVPGLGAVAEIGATTLQTVPGAWLRPADVVAAADWAGAQVAGGAHGVVLVQGTDTIEETASLLDLYWDRPEPLVVTGAMRSPAAPGADGPANLLDAVALATAPQAAGCGGLVCFAGEVHAAAEARKVDSTSPRPFGSPRTGPAGHVAEGVVTLRLRPQRLPRLDPSELRGPVPIVPTALGDDGALLRAALDLRPAGIVLVTLGAGHVSPAVLDVLAGAGVPVVACVRPERGALLHATYGFRGAEGDVRATGAIPAATLSPQAARIRLLAALGAGLSGEPLREAVAGGEA